MHYYHPYTINILHYNNTSNSHVTPSKYCNQIPFPSCSGSGKAEIETVCILPFPSNLRRGGWWIGDPASNGQSHQLVYVICMEVEVGIGFLRVWLVRLFQKTPFSLPAFYFVAFSQHCIFPATDRCDRLAFIHFTCYFNEFIFLL